MCYRENFLKLGRFGYHEFCYIQTVAGSSPGWMTKCLLYTFPKYISFSNIIISKWKYETLNGITPINDQTEYI